MNGAIGTVQYSSRSAPTTPNGGTPSNDMTLVGATAGPVVLHNVNAGSLSSTSNDAVNGAQVNALSTSVASALGGGAVFNPITGQLTAPIYNVAGGSYNNVGDALGALDGRVTGVNDRLTSLGAQVSNLTAVTQQMQQQIAKNRNLAMGGVASAMAISQIRYDDRPGKTTLGVGVGRDGGQTGFAVGLGATSENGRWRLNGAVSYSPGASRMVGGGGGVSYSW
jgi:autotransporter adhesin